MKKMKFHRINKLAHPARTYSLNNLLAALLCFLKQTKMSSTKIFQDMLQADMPEHLVMHVAKEVHRIFTKDTLQKINTMYSPFEKLFMESENVFDNLKKVYPDMTIHTDVYYEWITVVLKLTATKFIVWHNYEEGYINITEENFLMEGEVDEKENIYIFNKFIYMDEGRQPETIEDAEQYHDKKNKNMIPFQFLHFCMKNEHRMDSNVYKNAETYGKWVLPNKLINSFNAYPWEVPEDFADMMG